jgi:hypothetical protein
MNNVLAILGVVGITLAVVMNKGFGWLRGVWPGFFGCAQCFGFQLGFLVALFWVYRSDGWGVTRVVQAVLYGGATSLVSYLAYCLIHKWGAP